MVDVTMTHDHYGRTTQHTNGTLIIETHTQNVLRAMVLLSLTVF